VSFDGPPVRLAWGPEGARAAAARGDVLVVVDVLSFSTAVATAVERGAVVHAGAPGEEPPPGAERAVPRSRVPAEGRFSLSPLTFLGAAPGTRVHLASPNGAACVRAAASLPRVLVGSLLNASAVARAAADPGGPVTVLACGERNRDGSFRVALEDYLGAGAILAALPPGPDGPAASCARAFRIVRGGLLRVLLASASGRELAARGFAGDVEHAARLDLYGSVPALHAGAIARRPGA
jgi:2-phosphosulfolactate phosphatase